MRPTRPAAHSSSTASPPASVGTQSYDDDGSFTIGTRTDYADTLSGLAVLDSHARRRHARRRRLLELRRPRHDRRRPGPERPGHGLLPLHADRHRQRRQQRLALDGGQGRPHAIRPRPSLSLSDSSADVHTVGTTAFYRPAGAGSFDVTASSTDGQSGIASYSFPTLAGFVASGSGATKTYTLNTPTEPDGGKTVTAQNNAGRTNGSTFTLTADSTAPSGGRSR